LPSDQVPLRQHHGQSRSKTGKRKSGKRPCCKEGSPTPSAVSMQFALGDCRKAGGLYRPRWSAGGRRRESKVGPLGKLEIAKAPIVGKQVFSGGETKLIHDRHAGAIRCRIAKLSSKLCGTGTNKHRIIHIERCAFGVKYESEHGHGLFSRTYSVFQLNSELCGFRG
jgi:hypothetical protein